MNSNRYIAGVDWGRDELTDVVVVDATNNRVVDVVELHGMTWQVQRGQLTALCAQWGLDALWIEANGIGGPNIEALQAEGLPAIPYTMTTRNKQDLFNVLRASIEGGRLHLADRPELLREVMHDDGSVALALAWYGAQHGNAGISFV